LHGVGAGSVRGSLLLVPAGADTEGSRRVRAAGVAQGRVPGVDRSAAMILGQDSMIVSDLNKFEDPPMPADGEKHGLCRRSDRGWRLRTGLRDDWHWKGPGCGLSGST